MVRPLGSFAQDGRDVGGLGSQEASDVGLAVCGGQGQVGGECCGAQVYRSQVGDAEVGDVAGSSGCGQLDQADPLLGDDEERGLGCRAADPAGGDGEQPLGPAEGGGQDLDEVVALTAALLLWRQEDTEGGGD